MTGNYISRSEYQNLTMNLVSELTDGWLSPHDVQNIRLDVDGAVFEVFYLDRNGHKIHLPEDGDNGYCPTYYYTVEPVDALISW